MRSLLAITVSALALTGCVTENSYNGSDRPVVENQVSNTGAARTRIALALEYLKTGNNAQAKYNLERAAEFAPDLPEVHYSLAYYYQQVDEPALADKAYQRALKLDPDDPNTLNNYGVFLCDNDQYDRATEQFLKAIEVPSYIRVAESYENLALCAIEFNDFDNAEKYFISALNHSSQRASSMISLAALYYAQTDLHKAQQVLERYEASGKVSPRALLLSYLVQQRMGHIEKAETTAAILTQTYPSSAQASAIIQQQLKRTEFEVLREKYRQAQINELNSNADNTVFSKEPQIRIVKKKAPQRTNLEQQAPVSNNTEEQNSAVMTSLVIDNKNVAEADSIETTTQTTSSPAIDTAAVIGALTALELSQSNDLAENDNIEAAREPTTKSGFYTSSTKTVAQKPVNTAAIASTLTGAKPQTDTPAPVNDASQLANSEDNTTDNEVTLVAFGAPTPQPTNQAKANKSSTAATSDGKVVFYEPQKDPNVFAQSNIRYNNGGYTQADQSPQTGPLLNTNIIAPTIPYHIMQNGENLFSLSVRYNVKLQKILQWNGLKESDRIPGGQKIYLNDPHIFHEINAGDTLYSIASEHNVLIDQLMRWNKLSPDVALKPGYRLLLVDPDSYTL